MKSVLSYILAIVTILGCLPVLRERDPALVRIFMLFGSTRSKDNINLEEGRL